MERLKRPESRRMAEPLASVEAFEGFEGFEGQFRATEPRPQSAQLRPQSRAEPRAHSLASARFWSV